MDGKQVQMIAPPNSGSVFFNYKGMHSIVLMGIANANYELIYIDVGRNGRISDGGVYNSCSIGQAMDCDALNLPPPKPLPGRSMPVPFVVVGDDAFELRTNLMKPYPNRNLSNSKRIFNYRLSRMRRIIENVFGIMSARFRVLRSAINLDENKTKKVVKACCVLHNFLMAESRQRYAPPGSFDREGKNGEVVPGDWRQELQTPLTSFRSANRVRQDALAIQNEFRDYFCNEGDLEWQHRML